MPREQYEAILGLMRELPWHHLQSNHGTLRREIGGMRNAFTMGATLGPVGGTGYEETCVKKGRLYGINTRVVKGKCSSKTAARMVQEIWDRVAALMRHVDPDFQYTTVHALRNFVNVPHIDKNNTSHQYAMSFGDFIGGRLTIETSDPTVLASYDTRGRPTKVDGRRVHWVEDYHGDRFSLILYNVTGEPSEILSNFPTGAPDAIGPESRGTPPAIP
jgi:hypothetical protein